MLSLKELVRPYYLRWLYFPLVPNSKPTQFDACWQYPHWEITDEASEIFPPGHPSLPDFLVYPMTDCHFRVQRTQYFMRELEKAGHRCLVLNPNLGREFRHPPLLSQRRRVARLSERIFELHIGLRSEPVFHHRLLSHRESNRVATTIAQAVMAARSAGAIQLISFPIWRETGVWIREQFGFPIIYDCHDWLKGLPNVDGAIAQEEWQILRDADLILFSSQPLIDHFTRNLPSIKDKCLVVRNGVDASMELRSPPAVRPVVAGYVGAVENWFDSVALEHCLRSSPEIRFVVAGKINNRQVSELQKYPNLDLRGEVPYSQVHQLLAEFDVGLIPFQNTDLIRYTNPIKLYEYFAHGIPVVSTAMPEVEEYGELVYVAHRPEDFARQLRVAAAENSVSKTIQRRQVSERASWQHRTALWLSRALALKSRVRAPETLTS